MVAPGVKARTHQARTHQERRADSDRRIIDAAIELFAERGYQKTTLIQIGERAGFTGTLISNRYGSKQGLLEVVLDHILNRFQDEMADTLAVIEQGDLTASLTAQRILGDFIVMYLDDVMEQQSRIRALYVIMGEALGALPEIQSGVQKVNRVFRNHIENIVRYGMARGEFADTLEPHAMAVLIVGMLRGVAMQLLAESADMDRQAMIDTTCVAVLGMMQARSV